jgi:hypothetical protein
MILGNRVFLSMSSFYSIVYYLNGSFIGIIILGVIMGGIPSRKDMVANQDKMVLGGLVNSKNNRKCVKRKEDDINLELGEGIKLHHILMMEDSTLVGSFVNKRMNIETLKGWTSNKFAKLLGYEPQSMILSKGWIFWIMR